ncbi:hypothetical protein T09_6294 [Trichinella sp. T9]|nr:hypothetical protein T09_6294 [Trichinella sp. T9]
MDISATSHLRTPLSSGRTLLPRSAPIDMASEEIKVLVQHGQITNLKQLGSQPQVCSKLIRENSTALLCWLFADRL